MQTEGDLAALTIKYGAALTACDANRATLVQIIDAANAAGKEKK